MNFKALLWQQTYGKSQRSGQVFSIDIGKKQALILLSATPEMDFLQNMIRIITGTLIEVGDGRKNPDAVMGKF